MPFFRGRTGVLIVMAAVLTLGCDDDSNTSCNLAAPEIIAMEGIVVPGIEATITVSRTFFVRNTGADDASAALSASISPNAANAPILRIDSPDTMSITPGDSTAITFSVVLGELTPPGDYLGTIRMGPDCDPIGVEISVLGAEAAYSDRTTTAGVVDDLETSWDRRDSDRYAALLAEDFRFFFDPDTQGQNNLPEFFNKTQDSTQVAKLFRASRVGDIRAALTFDPMPLAVNEPGRDHWLMTNVADTFIEVDFEPDVKEPEGITFRVDGSIQRLYFRKGRTEADATSSSPTSNLYYLVEWRELGYGAAAAGLIPSTVLPTWGASRCSSDRRPPFSFQNENARRPFAVVVGLLCKRNSVQT